MDELIDYLLFIPCWIIVRLLLAWAWLLEQVR